MQEKEIEELFWVELKTRGVGKKTGINKNTIYNWRNYRITPSLGDMIEFLVKLGKLKLVKNNESH